MSSSLAHVTLVVADYDQAIAYFCDTLGFDLVEDRPIGGGKRWVLVRPPGGGSALLFAKAVTPSQRDHIGDQTGGRVAFFLHTDNFRRDWESMRARGVKFVEGPRHEPYGTVVVFEDVFGNRWDLVEPRRRPDA